MELDEMNVAAPEVPMAPTQESTQVAPEDDIEADEGPIDLDAPDEPEVSDEAEGTDDEAEPDQLEEYLDFELEPGKAVKVPKELEPYLMRQSDYTRKTQEVSALRREVEAEKAYVEQTKSLSNEEIQAQAVEFNIQSELAKYQAVNWQEWMNTDPLEAQSQYMRYQQLEKAHSQVSEYKQNLAQQRSQIAEQETANRLRATAEFAKKSIKGFTPELDARVTDFAVRELGFSRESLFQGINPQSYRALYLAYLGSQTLNRQTAAKPSSPTVQPTRTVTARSNPAVTKDPEQMSMSEYAEWRQSQLRKKR